MTARLVPSQKRSAERLATIVECAREHYRSAGRDRFEIPRVAEMAGCTTGTIYYYFTDRVALLDHIEPRRDHADALVAAIRAEVAQLPTDAVKTSPEVASGVLDRIQYLIGQ